MEYFQFLSFVPKIITQICKKLHKKNGKKDKFLAVYEGFYTTSHHRYVHDVVDGEFLAADVEGVECVGAVGAVL